jgi:serine/threonine protein kinase
MPLLREPDAEPLAGYRLIEPLGRGGFGEVWKCEAPGGLFKAIKFVEGDASPTAVHAPADAELTAIQHIKSIRHPFLLSMDRVEVIDGELVVVMELADQNLLDLFNERRRQGLAGVPRAELLHYLREAADVLDLLSFRHGLQHLDVKPANLFLVSGHVKVADFGLVRNLSQSNGRAGGGASPLAISPRYSAPELFRGVFTPFSDQYSLAIVFQEMLSGSFPFNGKNARRLAIEHTASAPQLAALSEGDQKAIGRALSKEAGRRFPSCRELIDALADDSSAAAAARINPEAAGTDADTKPYVPMAGTLAVRPASSKFLPDYEFGKCLGRSPSMETWEASTSQGTRRLVKFLYGVTGRDPRREEEAVVRLQSIRHAALPPLVLLPGGAGCLIAITDPIATSLRDRFQECRARGARGLPRPQLLDWLWSAAAALDDLAHDYDIQHQGLTPRHLLLDGESLRIGEFGFHPLIWGPAGHNPLLLRGRYAAPELSQKGPAPRCDVYSLAVVYQEMLTGVHPLRGRQATSPNLNPLGNAERAAVAKALEVNPNARFATCTAFLTALDDAQPGRPPTHLTTDKGREAKAVLARLIADSTNFIPASEPETWLPGTDGKMTLQCRFAASLPPSGAASRFDGFRKQWNAQLLRSEDNRIALAVSPPKRNWKLFFGSSAAVTIDIQWNTPRPPKPQLPEVLVRVVSGATADAAEEVRFKETAPLLLDSLRTHLHGQSERRGQERLLWAHPVEVCFRRPDGPAGKTLICQAKDISMTGMGLYLPSAAAGAQLIVKLTTPSHPEPLELTGMCVRVVRCGADWYEAGVLFL